jgi:methyl-accepting chemotaxis protein
LVTEVAGASSEQTQGITQINTAIALMDKVIQNNAASAEECAAAAEEMNAQSITTKQSVTELMELVGSKPHRATVSTGSSNQSQLTSHRVPPTNGSPRQTATPVIRSHSRW